MSKRTGIELPPQMATQRPEGISFEIAKQVMNRWNPALRAADSEDEKDNVISILDPIGEDYWTGEGVTAKRISAALRYIGADKDVIVNVNSPGGSLFEGLAIYNLFRQHKGEVTMRILGVAASAASVIAMAGDRIEIAKSAFYMVHNGWIMAMGNRNDLREAADWMEPFDRVIADIYADKSGLDSVSIQEMMDKETWIGGSDAVEQGFADGLLAVDKVAEEEDDEDSPRAATRRLESLMARQGIPRSERRRLLQQVKSDKPSAVDEVKPRADNPEEGKPSAAPEVSTGAALAISQDLAKVFK